MTREEAIQVLKKTIAYESDFAEAKRIAIEALSADRPTGEWIKVKGSRSVAKCNRCNSIGRVYLNYCSHCGARMLREDSEG